MGKPAVALANTNGKIRAAVIDYLGRFGGVYFAENPIEANDHLDSYLNV